MDYLDRKTADYKIFKELHKFKSIKQTKCHVGASPIDNLTQIKTNRHNMNGAPNFMIIEHSPNQ